MARQTNKARKNTARAVAADTGTNYTTALRQADQPADRDYTVIGLYYEPEGQRYATTGGGASIEAAIADAIAGCIEDNGFECEDDPFSVVAVIETGVELADMYTDGYTMGVVTADGDAESDDVADDASATGTYTVFTVCGTYTVEGVNASEAERATLNHIGQSSATNVIAGVVPGCVENLLDGRQPERIEA